jgi:hypothetical protein
MTYNIFSGYDSTPATRPTRLIELTRNSNQSISAGSALILNTVRATDSTHGVTVDGTTGEITLPPWCDYYIQASIEVDRASNSDSFRIAFTDSNGVEIPASDGGFDCIYEWHDSSLTTNVPNFTMTAVYVSTAPLDSIYLKCFSMASGSVMTKETSILITQVTR